MPPSPKTYLRVLHVHFLDLMHVVQTSQSNQYIHKPKEYCYFVRSRCRTNHYVSITCANWWNTRQKKKFITISIFLSLNLIKSNFITMHLQKITIKIRIIYYQTEATQWYVIDNMNYLQLTPWNNYQHYMHFDFFFQMLVNTLNTLYIIIMAPIVQSNFTIVHP